MTMMGNKKIWEQIYQQKPIIDKEYEFYYKLWYKYHLLCEKHDVIIAPPDGIPKTTSQLIAINKNSLEIRKKIGIPTHFDGTKFQQQKWINAEDNALMEVEKIMSRR